MADTNSASTLYAGLLLAFAAMLGIVFENIGSLAPLYDSLLNSKLTVQISDAGISKPILLWINDGLMAIFFLYVALEIKREVKEGALSKWSAAALPVYGAIGGIVVPSLIFIGIVGIDAAEMRGWGFKPVWIARPSFAHADVALSGLSLETLTAPLALAIAAGLFVGKQIGIFGMVWLAVKAGLAARAPELTWPRLYAVSCLAGIGFTMSLFIGGLAFDAQAEQNLVRIGVLMGSLASGILGAMILGLVKQK